jgi:predicted anti-sigma-YlaC factor YlaD
MNCNRYQQLMMGYIDNELDENEIRDLLEHLQSCDQCRAEMMRFKALNDITDASTFLTPEDKFWEGYWSGIYNRMERGLGWIFMLGGFILIVSGGIFVLFSDVILNPGEPLWIRIGIPCTMIGVVILMTSVCRERLRSFKIERYKDVRR